MSSVATADQIDEVLGHIVRGLRKRMAHMDHSQIQFLVENPNSRVIDRITMTLFENRPKSMRPGLQLLFPGIRIYKCERYSLKSCFPSDRFNLSNQDRCFLSEGSGDFVSGGNPHVFQAFDVGLTLAEVINRVSASRLEDLRANTPGLHMFGLPQIESLVDETDSGGCALSTDAQSVNLFLTMLKSELRVCGLRRSPVDKKWRAFINPIDDTRYHGARFFI